jgi:hypothetical protein
LRLSTGDDIGDIDIDDDDDDDEVTDGDGEPQSEAVEPGVKIRILVNIFAEKG